MRFGVTGHRTLPPGIAELATEHWRRELPTGAGLHGVTSLADGADQLFAAHVLEAGGTLEAILPSPRTSFAGSLTAAGSRDRLADFLRVAASVITMPYAEPCDQGYLAAGQAVVDRSDHLFAVWDGLPARGLGGTADIVAYARALGRPVTVLWIDGVRRT